MKTKILGMVLGAAIVLSSAVMAENGYYQAPGYNNARGAVLDVTRGIDEYDARANKTGYWVVGVGAAVNSLPLSASKFTLPLLYVGYESINRKSIGDMDMAWAFGLYDLMPEIEFAVMIPAKPFDFRISAGGFYDVIIGGTVGVIAKAGVIINKSMQFDLVFIPIGTQPTVSYSESLAQQHIVMNDGKHGLDFPVFGVQVSYRM